MENKIVSMEKLQKENINEIRIALYDTMCHVLTGYLKVAAEHKFGYKAEDLIIAKCFKNIKEDNNSYIYKEFVYGIPSDSSIYEHMDVTIAAALLRFDFKELSPGQCIGLYYDLIHNITEDRNTLIGHYTYISVTEAEEKIIYAFDHIMDFLSLILSSASLEKDLLPNDLVDDNFLAKEEKYIDTVFENDIKQLAKKF